MKPVIHGALSACVLLAGCAFGPVRVADPAAGPTAVLTVPYSVVLESVDGKAVPVRFARPGAKSQDYVIPAGARELGVQFSVIWNDAAKDDHAPVRSKAAVLPLTAEAGRRYRIVHGEWKTLEDARAVAANPGWRIVSDDGTVVPAPRPAPAPTPPAGTVPAAAPAPAAGEADESVRRMSEWWRTATPQQREAFLNGVVPGGAAKQQP